MKHVFFAIAALTSSAAFAIGAQMSAVNQQNTILSMTLEGCTIATKTVFVQIRSSMPTSTQEVDKCLGDAKDSVKTGFDEIKKSFVNKKMPSELVEWRLEWMAAFDAAKPLPTDTERAYLTRVNDARAKVDRAKNRLEIALE